MKRKIERGRKERSFIGLLSAALFGVLLGGILQPDNRAAAQENFPEQDESSKRAAALQMSPSESGSGSRQANDHPDAAPHHHIPAEEPLEAERSTRPSEKLDAIPEDAGFIRVRKIFRGIEEAQVPAEFQVTVKPEKGTEVYVLKTNPDSDCLKSIRCTSDSVIYDWEIDGLQSGSYEVSESGYEIDGCSRSGFDGSQTWTVTLDPEKITLNEEAHETGRISGSWEAGMKDGKKFVFVGASAENAGSLFLSGQRLSAQERKAVTAKCEKENWNVPFCFYSTDGDQTEFEVQGHGFSWNSAAQTLLLHDPSSWSRACLITWDQQEAEKPEIEIETLYTPDPAEAKAAGQEAESVEDGWKEFESGMQMPKDGWSASEQGSQNSPAHSETDAAGEGNEGTAAKSNETGSREEVVVDSGVMTDNLPFMIILAFAAGMTVIRCRKV
ncbi:MAG: hypothetical protein HUJ54_05330 [Erysipelotrichaceae bacterium]|nr:hypothetical protein [Erysipelotrichaceae bacterium]